MGEEAAEEQARQEAEEEENLKRDVAFSCARMAAEEKAREVVLLVRAMPDLLDPPARVAEEKQRREAAKKTGQAKLSRNGVRNSPSMTTPVPHYMLDKAGGRTAKAKPIKPREDNTRQSEHMVTKREAQEKARLRVAERKAQKAAEEKARELAEEMARQATWEITRRRARKIKEERAKRATDDQARREPEQNVRMLAEEIAREVEEE